MYVPRNTWNYFSNTGIVAAQWNWEYSIFLPSRRKWIKFSKRHSLTQNRWPSWTKKQSVKKSVDIQRYLTNLSMHVWATLKITLNMVISLCAVYLTTVISLWESHLDMVFPHNPEINLHHLWNVNVTERETKVPSWALVERLLLTNALLPLQFNRL